MSGLRYAGPFAFLAAIPALYLFWDIAPYAVPLALLLLLLAMSYVSDDNAPDGHAARALPILYIPLQIAVVFWAASEVARAGATAAGFFSLAVATGACTGVFGVLAAHEMVHSRVRWHRWLGAAMLTAMSYRHFRIAHIYGHHRYAATDRDAATARLGEGFYAFLARTLPGQFAEAWSFERHRVRSAKFHLVRNRIAQDMLLTASIYSGLWLMLGCRAAAFMAAESAVAILVLELFNYVAHYGFLRRADEPLHAHHSWNATGAANLLIFNMGRHSHHHRAPALSYENLGASHGAPKLPGGYAGAILLALVPPLWRGVMHPRLLRSQAFHRESVYGDRRRSAVAIP
ncbi:MAG: fatty acid desaturase [Alphaproteobacteria bacterium]|jgi:alkane 1-monooxygenase